MIWYEAMEEAQQMASKIGVIYAWVATEPDGSEGICSAERDDGVNIPLVGTDLAGMRAMRRYAELVRQGTGYTVRLVRFGSPQEVEMVP